LNPIACSTGLAEAVEHIQELFSPKPEPEVPFGSLVEA
jgi:hypothetical protein